MAVRKILTGHTSPETAYIVDDYPYGFRLRCSIRYWLEYKHGHGFRFCSQTTNPKRPGAVWNKPKYSTYFPIGFLHLNNDGHVTYACHSEYRLDDIDQWAERYAEGLQTTEHQQTLAQLRKLRDFNAHISARITTSDPVRVV